MLFILANEYRIFSILLWLLDCLEGKIKEQNIDNIFIIGNFYLL